jgi:hypothetical protein
VYCNTTEEVETVMGIVMSMRPLMPKAQLTAEKLVVGVAINIYVWKTVLMHK